MDRYPQATDRLTLQPLTPEVIAAFVAADVAELEALTGAVFPESPQLPPLFADNPDWLLDYVRTAPDMARPRLLVRRDSGLPVGAIGLAVPDAEGAVEIGYAVYPEQTGHGYATEAARALVQWALTQPEIRRVVAHIPPTNTASCRVAENAGLQHVGTVNDPDAGEVLLYEARL